MSNAATCEWDHPTRDNPNADRCGRPAKVQVNGPRGYAVCGIHARSAWRIGDVEQVEIPTEVPHCAGRVAVAHERTSMVNGVCPVCGEVDP